MQTQAVHRKTHYNHFYKIGKAKFKMAFGHECLENHLKNVMKSASFFKFRGLTL